MIHFVSLQWTNRNPWLRDLVYTSGNYTRARRASIRGGLVCTANAQSRYTGAMALQAQRRSYRDLADCPCVNDVRDERLHARR